MALVDYQNNALTLGFEHLFSLADLRGAPGTRPPLGPNSFIFMQFSGNF